MVAHTAHLILVLLVLSALYWRTASDSNPIPVPQHEIDALYDLYVSTSGDTWTWKSTLGYGMIWNFTEPINPCYDHWQGVDCTETQAGNNSDFVHIQQLNLVGYNMTGELPATIANLTELTVLNLPVNAINGSIPSTIGTSMKYLELFVLGSNSLTGALPESLANLTAMYSFSVCANYLKGPIPSVLGRIPSLRALSVCDNYFTGPIPAFLSELPDLQSLSLEDNLLDGPIPDSLQQLVGLQYLYLQRNKLTGSIPASLCELSQMNRILMYDNALTGTIPDCVGGFTNLTYFDVSSNDLRGSLPASLSDLDELLFLWAHDNQLTGPIPEDIGNCGALLEIYLSGNYLSQSLPSSLAALSQMTDLYLENNLFTGPLMGKLDGTVTLQQIYLQDNMFSGPLPKPFPGLGNLTELFLQSNKFSGSLDGVFDEDVQTSRIKILQLSNNQLTGSLPEAIFELPKLRTFAASINCLSGTLPGTLCSAKVLTTLILDGIKSAPACRTDTLPGLSSYQVPYNTHGSIPECIFELPILATLHLAGNGLTGPLPGDLSNKSRLVDLSISHNALVGTIPSALQRRVWTTLDLSFNRLTGGLDPRFASQTPSTLRNVDSSTYSLQNNRLSGKLPGALDQLRNISVLGSNMFSCQVDKSDLPQYDNEIATYSCGSDSFNYSYITLIGALLICVFGVLCARHYIDRLPDLQDLQVNAVKWDVDQMTDLVYLTNVCEVSKIMCKTGVLCTTVILLVLMPWYVSVSFTYGTYTHMYAWVISAAFLSGRVPTIVQTVFYMLLVIMVVVSSLYFVLRSDRKQQRARSSSRLISIARKQKEVVQATLPVRAGIYTAFLVTNLTVVVGINVAFVVMVLTQGNFVQFLAQVLVSAFKFMWNTVCTPYLIRWCTGLVSGAYEETTFNTLQILIALLNNIAIPCLVVAVISPSCFYSVFDPPPPVQSSFVYERTLRPGFGLTPLDGIQGRMIEHVTFAPPFAYDYQCSSSLITYYAPAFVYLAIAAALVNPVAWAIVVKLHKHATAGTPWYAVLDYLLSRLLKPVQTVTTEQSAGQRRIFDVNVHIVSLITYLGILLTFGVVFPPVAVAMCATMISVHWQMKLKVGRFVQTARELDGVEFVERIDKDCKGAVSLVKLRRSLFVIISFSCTFYAPFLFDTQGDADGFTAAVWVLIVMPLFPLVIYSIALVRRRFIVADNTENAEDADGALNLGDLELQLRKAMEESAGAGTGAGGGGSVSDAGGEEVVNVLREARG